MSKFNIRTMLFIIAVNTAGYIFFFVTSLLNYPADELLYIYKVPWVFEEALRRLLEHMPVLSFTAVLLAFGTIGRGSIKLPPSVGGISRPISKTILVLILFTLIYSALHIGYLPVTYQHRYERLYSSNLAKSYLDTAEQAKAKGDLELAYERYGDYLSIDGDNRNIKVLFDELEGQISIEQSEKKKEDSTTVHIPHSEYRNLGVLELLERAESALEKDDPFTAHYLAGIVLDMNENREDARRIAAEAMEKIATSEPSREEKEKYRVYHKKLAGYQALTRSRPVEAYYIFRELRESAEGDPDIREYYTESLKQARQVSYFIDEAKASENDPGIPKITFLNSANPGDGEEAHPSLVYIDKLVFDSGNYWAYGVEILEFSNSFEMISHLSTDYAGVLNHTLLLRGIDREDRGNSLEPVLYDLEGRPRAAEIGEINTVFSISPSVSELGRLTRDQNFAARLNLPALLEILPDIERFGYPKVQFEILILKRLLKPFLYLILSILAVGLGWHLRVHGSKLPFYMFPLVVPIPFVANQLVRLFEYSHQLVLSWSVLFGGAALGIVVLIALETLFLFLALLGISIHKEL